MEVWQTQGLKKFGIFTSRLRRSEKNQKLEKREQEPRMRKLIKRFNVKCHQDRNMIYGSKKVPSTYIF